MRLCLQDYIWDGIKRDRLVWMGDLHPEIAVVLRCYGVLEIVPQSLDWVREHTPLPRWMNGIGSYSMWWMILQRDWWLHGGDRNYLEAQRTYLRELLPAMWHQIEADGTLKWRGTPFLDWPSVANPGAVESGLHALLSWSLQCGESLCEALGETDLAEQCRRKIALLKRHPPLLPSPDAANRTGSKQVAALLSLAGLCDPKTANLQVLSLEPLQNLSTFYGFYTLQARAKAGDMQGALDVIRTYWGAMIDLGATSFWEHFELWWAEGAGRIDELPQEGKRDIHRECGEHCYQSYRHSLCHGWAAGPTAFLSEHVLGVQILEAGCKSVKITPDLGDLAWAEGTFPTPHGPIWVRHEKNAAGEIISHIEVPDGVRIITAATIPVAAQKSAG